MFKKTVVSGMSVALALVLAGALGGCKKAEQAKEEVKPTAQQASPAPAPQAGGAALNDFTFEDGTQKWYGRKGVKVSQDSAQKHGDQAGLKIVGTSSKGDADFAESPKFKLEPGKHYKFSGWMKVASFSEAAPKNAFWLKVGIYKDNKWMKNIVNNNYDLKKKGEWQLLAAEFDAPTDSNLSGSFTIDKRPVDKDVTATIYIDDVKIEQTN